MKTLSDITGQESGIVIYQDGDTAAICNWAHGEGIPIMSPLNSPIQLGWEITGGIPEVEEEFHIDDVLSELEGIEIMYDRNDDIAQMIEERERGGKTEGTMYVLSNGIRIIAPKDWA